ncbi:enoyl-CoA hydratase/isomerase family protein [Bacillus sp. Marseille-Q3570]|uniref:enoyl-CoA hydratase/isomerase family protein n=1 Tax=Bacillus sp. Marseille-Q3570 TaxID=2963522 RepID=UPI0021B7E1A3|nr:enoyl-CoA hydratase/isomerase family protein [Bacillus sp. Marseille-Q3570]
MEKVKVEVEDGIGWVILNQPERYNAVDHDMIGLIGKALENLKNDDGVKILVMTGAGEKSFCSGGDLSVFHQLHTEDEAYEMLSKMGEVLFKIFTFPKPTIALLNGVTVGGGCEIASACDLRIAYPNVKFGFIQGTLGITTGWGGSTFVMERMNPESAFEILISAMKYSAQDGYEKGFVQKVLDIEEPLHDFKEWIEPLTTKNQGVLQAYKQRGLDRYNLSEIKLRVDKEIRECARLWATDDHHQAVKTFLNRK